MTRANKTQHAGEPVPTPEVATVPHLPPSLSPSPDTELPEDAGVSVGLDLPAGLADHPRYRIVRMLGAGGMGVVYRAVHRLMEREVALKVIHPGLVSHPASLDRFLLEVKTAAKLSHPNIVAAHDAEQVGDVHFLVMEYVEGISLDRLVAKQGPLPTGQACHFIRQAALGLQHAQDKGMVHRDIKPHNLMVTRKGLVKVLDFGLARIVQEQHEGEGNRPLTRLGVILGTPDYIAPEQVSDSHRADIRSDLYSLGCTLYFLLAGRPPFPEGNALSKAISHVESFPPPLRSLRQDLPPELLLVIETMMAKSPNDRYQTPAEAALALQPFARLGNAQTSRAAVPAVVPPVNTIPIGELQYEPKPVAAKKPRDHKRESPSAKPRRTLLLGMVLGLAGFVAMGTVLAVVVPQLRSTRPVLGASKPRALIVLPHQEFWWPDYEPVHRILSEGGVEVVVCSSRPGMANPAGKEGQPVRVDETIGRARGKDYDAVIFTGSPRKPEYVEDGSAVADARRLIGEMMAEKKLVTGLCVGTSVLADARALEGRRATWPPQAQAVMQRSGAQHVNEAVVESDNVITGRDPAAAEAFARRVLERLLRRQ